MEYLKFLLTVIGVGYFITESTLAKPFREATTKLDIKLKWWITDKIQGVFSCIYCSSFWIGIIMYYITENKLDLNMITCAFSCMGSVYVLKNISIK